MPAPRDGRSFPDLRLRAVSGAAAAAAALVPLLLGGAVLTLFVAAVAAAAGWEHRRVTLAGTARAEGAEPAAFGAALAAATLLTGFVGPAAGFAALGAAAAGFAVIDLSRGDGPRWLWSVVGVAAWGLAAVAFLDLRGAAESGLATALWIAAVVIATDVGAYFAGRLIGGPKLWPRVSPKKTWAGLIGAVALAAAVGGAFSAIADGAPSARLMVISGLAAIVAQAGDLGESALKRRFGVKDSSGLIPGHGGVLDRVDGFAAATLVAAALVHAHGQPVFSW